MARRRALRRQRTDSADRRFAAHHRRLRFEPLEDRRVLSVYQVTTNGDAAGLSPSAGTGTEMDPYQIATLRSAVEQSNANPGADSIIFDASLAGDAIVLGGSEIEITEALVIDARPLAAGITVDADQASRIFNITASTGDFALGGLTLTGGRTTAGSLAGRGGAIRSLTNGNLTLDRSTVSGSSTIGQIAGGGGIFAIGSVTLTQSTVGGNSTSGSDAMGGGIFSRGAVTLTQSTVSGNYTVGDFASGGGIDARYSATLDQSTVSGNSTAGDGANGGGIHARNVTITQSTVSNNSTTGIQADGGGIYSFGSVTLTQSTVTDNRAVDASSIGGGVLQVTTEAPLPFAIRGSIVAGNTAGVGGADLVKGIGSTLTINYSLIGMGITPNSGGNNVVTDDPLLGPLADNGGPTFTHALLPGSPTLDAGDPTEVAGENGVPEFDQRGNPYGRVRDGDVQESVVIDIGAYEAQGVPESLPGDYNRNGIVDAADYTVWRDTLGAGGLVPLTGADGDGNGAVDVVDYRVWKSHFGAVLPLPDADSGAVTIVRTAHDQSAGTPTEPAAEGIFLAPRLFLALGPPSHVYPTHSESPSPQAVDLLLAVASGTWPTMDVDGASILHSGDDPEAAGSDPSLPTMDEALAELASGV
jgi:hypothetical protein